MVCCLSHKQLNSVSGVGGGVGGEGGVLSHVDYTGMCHCSVYGFQAFLSRIGHRKHNILGQEQGVKFKQV